MRNKYEEIVKLICLLVMLLCVVGCSALADDIESIPSNVAYCTISGNIALDGANPSIITSSRNVNDSRTAVPILPTTITYAVKATASGYDDVTGIINEAGTSFRAQIPLGTTSVTWTILVTGIYMKIKLFLLVVVQLRLVLLLR